MADENNEADKTASAARRPEVNNAPASPHEGTGAGQEARRGNPPGEHTSEHQSNYGGGGANGGAATQPSGDDDRA